MTTLLGWTRSGGRLPPGCLAKRMVNGNLVEIVAVSELSEPRDRLALLQTCFRISDGFLPAPLGHDAICPDRMAAAFERIGDCGQFSLHLHFVRSDEGAATAPTTGRGFLRHRRQSNSDARKARTVGAEVLRDISERLKPRGQSLRPIGTGFAMDLLFPRGQEASVRNLFSSGQLGVDIHLGQLVASGLWAPVGFAAEALAPDG